MDEQNEVVDSFARQYVRDRIRELVGLFGIRRSDRADLEQEIYTHLIERYPQFDPDRGKKTTFTARLVDRAIVSNIRYRCAAKRDYRRESGSLNDPLTNGHEHGVEQGQTLDTWYARSHRDSRFRTEQEQTELRIDVEAVMEGLSPEQQAVWRLRPDHSIAKIAEEADMPECEVRKHLAEIRSRCENSDLDRYF